MVLPLALMFLRVLPAMHLNTLPQRVVQHSSSGRMIPLQPSTIPAHLRLIHQTSGDVPGRIIPVMAVGSPGSRAISNMLKGQAGCYSNRLARARTITPMRSSTSRTPSSPKKWQRTWDSHQSRSNQGSLCPGLATRIQERLPSVSPQRSISQNRETKYLCVPLVPVQGVMRSTLRSPTQSCRVNSGVTVHLLLNSY